MSFSRIMIYYNVSILLALFFASNILFRQSNKCLLIQFSFRNGEKAFFLFGILLILVYCNGISWFTIRLFWQSKWIKKFYFSEIIFSLFSFVEIAWITFSLPAYMKAFSLKSFQQIPRNHFSPTTTLSLFENDLYSALYYI